MDLSLDFLPVFEGEADVVGSVDSTEVHQPVPALQREFGQLIRHGCKGFQEILNAGPLGLHLMDFGCDRVQSGLGLLESFGQAVVAFLVFGLVEGDLGIFVDPPALTLRFPPSLVCLWLSRAASFCARRAETREIALST